MEKITPRIFLKPKEEKEIEQGFPWVFDNEIESIKYSDDDKIKKCPLKDCTIKNGAVAEIFTSAGGFLGTGVFNKASKITVRIIGKEHADVILKDTFSYYKKIIANAINIRNLEFEKNECCRLIFAEADFIPGLICERYIDDEKIYLVVQFLSLSCEIFRNEILDALKELTNCDFIYERSDAQVREKEGLEQKSGFIYSRHNQKGKEILTINENGILLNVDIAHGQKTGYFLDQKFNRMRIRKFCKGKKVLDTFTHTGAFGLNAAAGGAKEVVSADISKEAVALVNQNIKLNDAQDKMTAVCADVFDLLKQYEAEGKKFDVIILDPPAFTKSASSINKAYSGYKEINLRAMRLLNESGILVTCSCSHYFDANTFYSMLMKAAHDSHKKIQILEKRGAASDHPVLAGYPKSEYLKCAICRVL